MKPKFYITHLYPNEMSIYGDMGNIIAIKHILNELGIDPVYQPVNIGEKLPAVTDWYFIGGGQDKEQLIIYEDLLEKKDRIITDVRKGVGLLAICGGYQLLGEKFLTGNSEMVTGIGLFDVETVAPSSDVKTRCVGNLVESCVIPGLSDVNLVGFENHSGQTRFTNQKKCLPLGRVVSGYGNNLDAVYEGCVYKNAVGTYLHGSCLPKNPQLNLWFIRNQLDRKGIKYDLSKLNYSVEEKLNKQLVQKFS